MQTQVLAPALASGTAFGVLLCSGEVAVGRVQLAPPVHAASAEPLLRGSPVLYRQPSGGGLGYMADEVRAACK